jgi:UDP-N-acetyl-2-amino-2-deoxyglucuronate dehydrogenase
MILSRPEPITGRRIRTALVGCGRIAANHFDAIKSQADALDLVAVVDTDSTARDRASQESGAMPFDRLDTMLANVAPDLTVLATPSGLHASQAILAAEHGSHVVTEKPMATRWRDGNRMVEAFDRAGRHLLVVKQNRLNKTIRSVKAAIEQGRFGRIYMVSVNVFWTRPQAYYDSARWRGTWEFDGGAFMNQASHYVDLLDWLIGPVESVQAYTSTLSRNIEVEDTGTAAIKWRSGALGSINVTMLTYPRNFEGSITIIGEDGTVRIGGIAINEIQHWEFSDTRAEDEAIKNANYQTNSVYGFGHRGYYTNVVDVLRGVQDPNIDGREGLRSLELLAAIYISARDARRVSLPLDH